MIDDRRFEQQLPEAMVDLAATSYPAYVDDVLAITARTPRRPAWRFPSRWLPVELRLPSAGIRTQDLRPVLVLGLVLLLVLALIAVFIGSRQRLPRPFGPARNGDIIYSADHGAYIFDEDGGSRLLFDGEGNEVGLTYSLDGTRIAFIRLLGGQEFLWVADADGTNQIQLIERPLVEPTGLVWSPDGRQIAIGPKIGGASRIQIVQADGSGSTILDKLPFPARDPVWRPPDGQELVVRGWARGRAQLYVVAIDGSTWRPIGPRGEGLFNDDQWDQQGAAWSPDGLRLAYNSIDAAPGARGYEAGPDHADDLRFQVHVIEPDESNRIIGGRDINVMESWPSWSPDGSLIAIERWRWAGNSWLAILPADGSGPGLDVMFPTRFEPDKGWAYTWAPDGTRILAFYDTSTKAVSIDVVTGGTEEIDWPLTERPAWQRLAR
jgi:Tol biopolymer transport system component